MSRVRVFSIALVLLPVFLAFRNVFSLGPIFGGDAPYFYPDVFRDLLAEPSAWVSRGENFGGINKFLNLAPMMFVYGLLGSLGLSNDIVIRILFYIPSLVFAGIGTFLLTRYLKFSGVVSFFSVLTYLLATYYILLVDGGQVGVALAYGIFPITLFLLKKHFDAPAKSAFVLALVASFFVFVVDPRVGLIAFMTFVIWVLIESLVSKDLRSMAKLKYPALIFIITLALSSYFLYPFLKLLNTGTLSSVSGGSVSAAQAVTFFSPHWPDNEFGRVSAPPLVFFVIPLLVGFSLLQGVQRMFPYFVVVAVSVFLSKGGSPPLGEFYLWLTQSLPFGFVFRDSTKFFIPGILFSGILVGRLIDALTVKIGRARPLLLATYYLLLIFLVSPAIFGNLNFNLSFKGVDPSLTKIADLIASNSGFARSLWFPNKHPLAYHSEGKPALDADKLADERPFAQMNVGSFDKFNFLNNERFADLFRILGIKYAVISGTARRVNPSAEETTDWENLANLVANKPSLRKVDYEGNIPLYEIEDTADRMHFTPRILGVVGSTIFAKTSYPTVYFEDGKLDPRMLSGIDKNALSLVFNDKEKKDLTMSFLSDFFVGPNENISNTWAVYKAEDYLAYKYQLLIRGIKTSEFDYQKGIAFSTVANETISFNLKAKEDGDFLLAGRVLLGEGGEIELVLDGVSTIVSSEKVGRYFWFTNNVRLKKGTHTLTIKNKNGLSVLNVVSLVPQASVREAEELSENFVGHFSELSEEELPSLFGKNPPAGGEKVSYEKVSNTYYKVSKVDKPGWIVFTDSYHPLWKSVPIYSMLNGFYVKPDRKIEIVFDGQKYVRMGIYLSIVSFSLLFLYFFWNLRE